jgi:hypothetical protein
MGSADDILDVVIEAAASIPDPEAQQLGRTTPAAWLERRLIALRRLIAKVALRLDRKLTRNTKPPRR